MNMYTNESFFDTLLCWIRPTRDFLSFVHAELRRLHVTRIVSVGCGCGFLEWLIKRACSGQYWNGLRRRYDDLRWLR